jgi:murein tripeptide amidase MpaA
MFALDLPYSTMESAKFYDRILLKKMRGMISVEKIEYGRTLQGSPLNSIVITRKKSGDSVLQKTRNSEGSLQRRFINLSPLHSKCQSMPDSRNKSIIIIGRLNGIDTSSSFSIEGMVEYLFENNEFDSLKKTYNFYLIPFANVDGVKYGNAATNLTGSNLNGNWKSPSKDYQP